MTLSRKKGQIVEFRPVKSEPHSHWPYLFLRSSAPKNTGYGLPVHVQFDCETAKTHPFFRPLVFE